MDVSHRFLSWIQFQVLHRNQLRLFSMSSRRTPCGRTPLTESGLAFSVVSPAAGLTAIKTIPTIELILIVGMVLYIDNEFYVIQILESFYVEIIIFPVIFDGQTPPVHLIPLHSEQQVVPFHQKKAHLHFPQR